MANDGFMTIDSGYSKEEFLQLMNEILKIDRNDPNKITKLTKIKTLYSKKEITIGLEKLIAYHNRLPKIISHINEVNPDIIAIQEVDCFKQIHALLTPLGYTCGPGEFKTLTNQDYTNVKNNYNKFNQNIAYASKFNSTCYNIGKTNNIPNSENDGCAIFWKADKFNMTSIDKFPFHNDKKQKICGAVKVTLSHHTHPLTPKDITILTTHIPSGDRIKNEKNRLDVIEIMKKEEFFNPTGNVMFLIDANSPPNFPYTKGQLNVYHTLLKMYKNEVSQSYTNISVNKMRGIDSNQPEKIGIHHCKLIDYIFFSNSITFKRLINPILHKPATVEAFVNMIPSNTIPSDHYPIVCEITL